MFDLQIEVPAVKYKVLQAPGSALGLGFDSRAHDRILKMARTIADLNADDWA